MSGWREGNRCDRGGPRDLAGALRPLTLPLSRFLLKRQNACGRPGPALGPKRSCGIIKASSETADPQEALAELRAGKHRLWSTMPAPAHGRSETYLAAFDGRGGRCETMYILVTFLMAGAHVLLPRQCVSAALSWNFGFGLEFTSYLVACFFGVGIYAQCVMPSRLWNTCMAHDVTTDARKADASRICLGNRCDSRDADPNPYPPPSAPTHVDSSL